MRQVNRGLLNMYVKYLVISPMIHQKMDASIVYVEIEKNIVMYVIFFDL